MNSKRRFDRRMMASAFIAVFLTTGCASPNRVTPQTAATRDQAQIEQRLGEVFAAAENQNFDQLDSYHLYGRKFTKFTGSSAGRLDATAGRKGEHDGLAAAKGLKMQADALKIDLFGNVGIATFILDYSFDSGGQTIHRRDRSTLVFVKEGGAWKIAHEHLSPINP